MTSQLHNASAAPAQPTPPSRLPHIGNDIAAGIVVFLVALPLCLGIANASGVPPFAGLVSGIIGGLVVATLSGSSLSVSGPAAGLVVIVVTAISSLGSFSAFLTAVMIAGMLQIMLGLLRTGWLAAFVPVSVIKGMLASIGLILIIKQVPLAFGFSDDISTLLDTGHLPHIALANLWEASHPSALLLTITSLAILFAWETPAFKRYAWVRRIPAPLAVVLLGLISHVVTARMAPALSLASEHRVLLAPLNSWSDLLAGMALPDPALLWSADVWRVAATLAIVASLETLLSLEAVEQMDEQRRRASPDRELKAQGVGNMVAGLLGGLPLTAVIVRSAANVNAGARTRLSAVVHGVLLLASLFALTSVLNLIPLACLAAILIHTGYKLARPALFIAMVNEGYARFIPFAVTIVTVLATDLLIGIVTGIVVSTLLSLRSNLHQTFTLTRQGNDVLLRIRKDASFLAKPLLVKQLSTIDDGAHVLIDAERADFIDRDVIDALNAFIADAPRRHIVVVPQHWPASLPAIGGIPAAVH